MGLRAKCKLYYSNKGSYSKFRRRVIEVICGRVNCARVRAIAK